MRRIKISAVFTMCVIAAGWSHFINAAEPVFSSAALIVGRAEFSGNGTWKTLQMNSAQLSQGSKYVDLAWVKVPTGTNLSSSTASLNFSGIAGSTTKTIELVTGTNVSSPYRAGISQLHTTSAGINSGPGFVDIRINPNRAGETFGKLVNVTLKASYRNTNIIRSSGVNSIQVAYIVGGSQGFLLNGNDYTLTPGAVYSNSKTFHVPIGGTIRIGMVGFSNAPSATGVGARLNLSITVP